MRVHDLLAYQGPRTLERLPAWWEDIDDDPRWQDSVFIALAVAYGTLAVVALVQVELFLLLMSTELARLFDYTTHSVALLRH